MTYMWLWASLSAKLALQNFGSNSKNLKLIENGLSRPKPVLQSVSLSHALTFSRFHSLFLTHSLPNTLELARNICDRRLGD